MLMQKIVSNQNHSEISLTPFKMAIIKKREKRQQMLLEDVEKLEHLHSVLVVMKKWCSFSRKQHGSSSKKIKNKATI
jgi:hypothetical protein